MDGKSRYNPNIHGRRSIRLEGYDYSLSGLYFITICLHEQECLFGEIVDNKIIFNGAGKIANECWLQIPQHFPNVILHEYVVMPNHVHGIVELTTPVGSIEPNGLDVPHVESRKFSAPYRYHHHQTGMNFKK